MQEHERKEEFSFKNYFVPFTTAKTITWIIIFGLFVYCNSLFNGFVWDDKIYLINNPDIRTLNLAYLFGPNTWNNGLYYRPLTALYFSLAYFIFNLNPLFYHFLQVLIHITNSVLLFFVFKKFINKHISFVICLIFLIHPIQVESVAFIASTLSPLSFLFGLVALLVSFENNLNAKRILLICFFLLLSTLIKETGFLFLPSILLYRMLFQFKKSEVIVLFLAEMCLSVIYFLLRFFVGKVSLIPVKGAIIPIASLNFMQRLENIPAIIFYYLKTFFYPEALAIDQQWVITNPDFYNFILPLLLDTLFFLVLIALGYYLYKNHEKFFKPFLFFFLWFVVGLGFYLQIFPLDITVADRFFYYPIVGLLGMLGIGIMLCKPVLKKSKYLPVVFVLTSIIIIGLSVRTIIRNSNWHDEITLYSHDSKIYDSMNDEVNLGSDYAAMSNYQEALVHYEKAVAILPTELDLYDVGYVYEEMGNLKKAEVNYRNALAYIKYPADQHRLIDDTISNRLKDIR